MALYGKANLCLSLSLDLHCGVEVLGFVMTVKDSLDILVGGLELSRIGVDSNTYIYMYTGRWWLFEAAVSDMFASK